MITDKQNTDIIKTLKPYHPSKIGVFGSYARSEAEKDSDIDILLKTDKKINLLELVELERELSNILGIKVDLVTENSINKHLKPYIQKEVTYILDDE